MVRQVLQRAGADVLERLGLSPRDDGPPPPPPMARPSSGCPRAAERPRSRQRERETAEEAHRATNPRVGTCGCGCCRLGVDRAPRPASWRGSAVVVGRTSAARVDWAIGAAGASRCRHRPQC